MARILIIGKVRSPIHWVEDVHAAARALGHDSWVLPLNRGLTLLAEALRCARRIHKPFWDTYLLAQLDKYIKCKRPDIILFVGALHAPVSLLKAAYSYATQCAVCAWVGDKPDPNKATSLRYFHRVYITDTAFRSLITTPIDRIRWLPLGVNDDVFYPCHAPKTRDTIFVGVATLHRATVLRRLRQPVTIVGPNWRGPFVEGLGQHVVLLGNVAPSDVAMLYRTSKVCIDIRNECNIIHGVNQRIFETAACGVPVITERVPDVEQCFDIGREILTWTTAEELDDNLRMLLADNYRALALARQAVCRVMSNHTYKHRLRVILEDIL